MGRDVRRRADTTVPLSQEVVLGDDGGGDDVLADQLGLIEYPPSALENSHDGGDGGGNDDNETAR